MNKKTKRSIILTSLASIAFAGSLLAGSTYALFTSESTNNIVVSSGKVKVSAVVTNLITYTGTDLTGVVEDDETKIKESTEFDGLSNGDFMNGGTAKYNEETGELVLDKMSPGDKVTFTIKVTNESTVNTKYRTVIKSSNDGGLFNGLEVLIDGTKYDGTEKASAYLNLLPGKDPTDIDVSISLPSDASNDYQGKSCTIISTVEAIQGNAHVGETVANKDNLKTALTNGTPASLSNDLNLDNGEWFEITKDTTIYGNGKTLKADESSVSGDNKGRVINVDSQSDVTITLVDLNIVGPTCNEYNRGISIINSKNVKVVLDNCTVSANHYAFNVASGNTNVELVFKNTTFEGYAAFQNWSKDTKATFENCTLKGINQWSGSTDTYATIVAYESVDLSFKNCSIQSIEQGEAGEALLGIDKYSTLSFENCNFSYDSSNNEYDLNFTSSDTDAMDKLLSCGWYPTITEDEEEKLNCDITLK